MLVSLINIQGHSQILSLEDSKFSGVGYISLHDH